MVDIVRKNSIDADLSVSLIEAFKQEDLKLRIAIESGDVTNIQQQEARFEQALEDLIAVDFELSPDSMRVYKFLFERFVLRESCSNRLRKRICERVLGRL